MVAATCGRTAPQAIPECLRLRSAGASIKTSKKYSHAHTHPPTEWRVRGPLSNLKEFWDAFGIKEGDKMRRSGEDIVTIW